MKYVKTEQEIRDEIRAEIAEEVEKTIYDIARRAQSGLRMGNYSRVTSRIFTDLGHMVKNLKTGKW